MFEPLEVYCSIFPTLKLLHTNYCNCIYFRGDKSSRFGSFQQFRVFVMYYYCLIKSSCSRVVYRVGILGQLFGTPPQLLEHRPIEDSGTTFWNTIPTFGTPTHQGFWDNFLEHHPNFWNTTPSSRGDSGTSFWNTTPTFGAPPHRRNNENTKRPGQEFWCNLWNTIPLSRTAQTARVGHFSMRAN